MVSLICLGSVWKTSISICNIWHSKARLFVLDVVFGTLDPTDKLSTHRRLSTYHIV